MRQTIAIFLHHPECSTDCVEAMVNVLSPTYNIRTFIESDLDNDDFFSNINLIAFPGGIGDSDTYFDLFNRRRANRIANFISNNGHYLGICMGAYWAGDRYFNILDSVEPVQYIKRPNANIRRSFGTTADVIWNDTKETIYFYDGCALIGDQSKFETIATYINGDPMAIIQDRIGLIGCHPESQEYWYDKPYMIRNWHKNSNHKLLLEFVNRLMQK
jgi:glutamine amidotransferase-like uncharacterized protein